MVERHAHDRVAGLEQRHVGGVVGLRAGVGLDVRVLGAEELLGAVDRELLGDVDLLASAVVAPPRVALRVLVRQHRARRLEHGLGHEVLRGDHLERALLALELAPEHARDVGVDVGQRGGLEVVGEVGHRQIGPCRSGPVVYTLARRLGARAQRPLHLGHRHLPSRSTLHPPPESISERSTTVEAVPGSSPASISRSTADRRLSSTSASARGGGSPVAVRARLEHRAARAGQRPAYQPQPERPGALPAGERVARCGLATTSVTGPGRSAASAWRVRGPSSAISSRIASGREEHHRRGLAVRPPLELVDAARRRGVERVAREPVDGVGGEERDAPARDAALERRPRLVGAVALDRDGLAHRVAATTRSMPARSRRVSDPPEARRRRRDPRPPRPGRRRPRARSRCSRAASRAVRGSRRARRALRRARRAARAR